MFQIPFHESILLLKYVQGSASTVAINFFLFHSVRY